MVDQENKTIRVNPLLRYRDPRQSASTNGQFLIEAIVAGSVLIMGFTGIMALLARAMHANRIVTNNYIGTYLAAEGIEIVKNILDHNVMMRIGCEDWCVPPIAGDSGWDWDTGINTGGNDTWRVDATGDTPSTVGLLAVGGNPYLYFDAGTNRYGYQSGDRSIFRRTVTITKNPSSNPIEIEVVSRVWWSTGLLQS